MHARVTTVVMDPARADDAIAQVEQNMVPKWKELDGFKGFTLLVDRESGKGIGMTYWESEEAMRASEEAVSPGRQAVADAGGASGEPQVERFEVAVDTMV